MIENAQLLILGIIGQQNVGKTSLLSKYFRNQLPCQYKPTIAVQISYSYYTCHEGTMLRVKCWDTSGQNKYKNMVCYHLREAHVIVVMFDLTDLESFSKAGQWLERIKSQGLKPKLIYVVGNKLDLVNSIQNVNRNLKKQIQEKFSQFPVHYVEISVKNQTKFQFLDEAFQQILNQRSCKIIQINSKKVNSVQKIQNIQSSMVSPACQCKIF